MLRPMHARVQPKIAQCLLLNGCIFLGSIAWWSGALLPVLRYAMALAVAPAWGAWWARSLEDALTSLYSLAWLLPAYAVTLLVSGIW